MIKKYGLYSIWLFACIGTLCSLYFSGIRNIEPCHLCWYQRISLFPLALIFGLATYRDDRTVVPYTLPLIGAGLGFALYQIAIQEIPGWNPIDMCGAGPNCAEKLNIGLGPITIPMLSAANFLMLGSLAFVVWKNSKKEPIS